MTNIIIIGEDIKNTTLSQSLDSPIPLPPRQLGINKTQRKNAIPPTPNHEKLYGTANSSS